MASRRQRHAVLSPWIYRLKIMGLRNNTFVGKASPGLLKAASKGEKVPDLELEPFKKGAAKTEKAPQGRLFRLMVEVAGIEPASDNVPSFDLHA